MGTYVFRLQTLHLPVHKRHICLELKIKKQNKQCTNTRVNKNPSA